MANITDFSFYKYGELFIPLAEEQYNSTTDDSSPNNEKAIEKKITKTEKSVLLNSLGLDIYKELQTALELPDFDNDAPLHIKELVNGVEYDGKIWEGLKNEFSLLAYAVKYYFLGDIQRGFFTSTGLKEIDVTLGTDKEKASKDASSEMTNLWNIFLDKYQGNIYNVSYIQDTEFVDYLKDDNNIEVSLYQFLEDNKNTYSFDKDLFRIYEYKQTSSLWMITES